MRWCDGVMVCVCVCVMVCVCVCVCDGVCVCVCVCGVMVCDTSNTLKFCHSVNELKGSAT